MVELIAFTRKKMLLRVFALLEKWSHLQRGERKDQKMYFWNTECVFGIGRDSLFLCTQSSYYLHFTGQLYSKDMYLTHNPEQDLTQGL